MLGTRRSGGGNAFFWSNANWRRRSERNRRRPWRQPGQRGSSTGQFGHGNPLLRRPHPPPVRGESVNSRSERPGDDAFLDANVTFMASSARVEFSAKLSAAVVAKASVRRTSLHPPELLSVRQA